MGNHLDALVEVDELDASEGRSMLNTLSLDTLGIDVDEFLVRLSRGEYNDTEDEAVLRLVMLAPFAG